MKQKDVVMLVVAAGIFLVVGYVGYTQILGKKQSTAPKTVTVEVVGPIPASFDSSALSMLGNDAKVKDFNSPVDLSGLGNFAPFGP